MEKQGPDSLDPSRGQRSRMESLMIIAMSRCQRSS